MSVTVVLRHECGTEVRRIPSRYEVPPITRYREEYPMLAGVDPYGDTVFNGMQMRWLRDEVRKLLVDADLEEEARSCLDEIVRLCEAGQSTPHQFLWFVGD